MIVVTAGHVDHGKTALLQALTGTDTAHLPEEKKRGMTIDLGYAYLPVKDFPAIGFIDVPGHQKFLSNMLAGLGGIKYAMLIIAADEGIKPQTIEHIHLLKLLHIENILVVISKIDKLAYSTVDLFIEQIKTAYPFLANSPFFITSAKNNQGIDQLKHYLIDLNKQNNEIHKPFRYAIDRVFNIKGVGLIVTGTAISGQVKVGDEFYLSNGKKIRIKQIHAQNTETEIGYSDQRLALNLANVDKDQIKRGDWIVENPHFYFTDRISVYLTSIHSLKENNAVHLYHFASHITGKLNLLNNKELMVNQQGVAEIILDQPLLIAYNDRIIIRSGDNQHTLAGAQVLDIYSPKRNKRSQARLDFLNKLSQSPNYSQRIALAIKDKPLELNKLLWNEQQFKQNIIALAEQNHYILWDNWIVNQQFKQDLADRLITKMTEYHQKYNDQLGITKARLYRIAALQQPEKLVYAIIDQLIMQKQLAQTRGWIHLPDHRIEFNQQENRLWQQIIVIFKQTNQALWVRDIANQLQYNEQDMRNLLYKAGKLGYLIPIVKDRFLLQEQVTEIALWIKQFIQSYGEISVNQLRDELNYGRKLAVQLIEYFDRSGFLRRKGNIHLLRDSHIYDN